MRCDEGKGKRGDYKKYVVGDTTDDEEDMEKEKEGLEQVDLGLKGEDKIKHIKLGAISSSPPPLDEI